MVLFEVKWLRRQQRGTATFQERYSSHLCGIIFQTLGQEYDMRLAMQCSSILYVLFEIKVVKCKLSSRFGVMKMLPRAVCSSTQFALVVIRIWTSWTLMMTLFYFRMEQSPGSCFLWKYAILFRCDLVWESLQPLGRHGEKG